MYRNTYAEINLDNIQYNVSSIIKKYNNYQYYFGVVKADCYGHGIKSVSSIIKGGCNYLAVATLEEALKIRENHTSIPILCLGNIHPNYLSICQDNNITITINSLEYTRLLYKKNINNLKVHIKIDTGMNRLGVENNQELLECINLLKKINVAIEGIYTHIYHTEDRKKTNHQFKLFEEIVTTIKKENIPIVHCQASEALTNYPKPYFINGCRLGIIMYGFTNSPILNLKSTFCLHSQIIQIHRLKHNETVGYNGIYHAKEDELIGVASIGYADGIIKKNTGRYVYINNTKYPIIGNICMDMLFIKIDEKVKLYDQVNIIKDVQHIKEISSHLETIPYEVLCGISKRVPRIYINNS